MHGTARLPLIIATLFFLGVVAALVAAAGAGKKRVSRLAKWAREKGFFHDPDPPGEDFPGPERYPVMGCGILASLSGAKSRNRLTGATAGHEWLIFDIHGWCEHGRMENAPASWTVVILSIGGPWPRLHIEPSLPLVSRLHPERGRSVPTGRADFDRRFLIFGNEKYAAGLLGERMRECLLDLSPGPGRWYRHLYIEGGHLAVVEPTLAPPVHLDGMMDIARRVADCLPRPPGEGGPGGAARAKNRPDVPEL